MHRQISFAPATFFFFSSARENVEQTSVAIPEFVYLFYRDTEESVEATRRIYVSLRGTEAQTLLPSVL